MHHLAEALVVLWMGVPRESSRGAEPGCDFIAHL